MATSLQGGSKGDNLFSTASSVKIVLPSCTRVGVVRRVSLDRFLSEFAFELDIFDSAVQFPSWVYGYREELLGKLTPEMRKVCRWLKGLGFRFKIKWPVEVCGKWKFADVLFPGKGVVLMLTNAKALGSRPHWMLSDRAEFFRGLYRVVEVETMKELEMRYGITGGKLFEDAAVV